MKLVLTNPCSAVPAPKSRTAAVVFLHSSGSSCSSSSSRGALFRAPPLLSCPTTSISAEQGTSKPATCTTYHNLQGKRFVRSQGYRCHRLYRYTGIRPIRCETPRSDWQIAREREFLKQRSVVPLSSMKQDVEGNPISVTNYVKELTEDDVHQLPTHVKDLLTLETASSRELHQFRKRCLVRKFQVSPFDTNSPAVRIACLTEKILNLRAHMIRTRKDSMARRVMTLLLSRRMKVMKALYKSDFLLYKYVCEELSIRLVRFAIPEYRDPSRMVAPMGIDGDKCKWLIRQKLYKKKNMPRMFMDATKSMTGWRASTLVRHTHHPIEPVPEDFGKAAKISPQQVSPHFPYGVRGDRVRGDGILHNPTEPGPGHQPARML
ncbi:unnamed protein product [Amoebophrya sp. A120]|nr:unnamed protein product [Amoebophrya sp. A120]|eukprot:GSA120T00006117001.1